jgi:serine/threonine protein kinase
MPAPTSPDELFAVVEKSRLVSPAVLGNYRSLAAAEPGPPDRVAERMVRDGVLTTFQAGLLLEGKSRPFFVGPYKVLSRIGNGNSGVVYLCEHVSMRRKVAVKVLQGRRAKDGVALQRFLREARAAAALNHPNVVHALDLGCEADVHYLSMEYIDGSSLMGLVRDEGPIPARRLAGYLRQAAAGLAHAHAAGLIHRDITPSNVMVGRDGVVKLLDLGLALFAECEENLTQGAPLGSVGYIAPEQARDGHAVDARADIYSLGATVAFAMSGKAPSPRRGAGDTPAPKRDGRTESDFERLLAVVDRMMAADPADRFQTAAEVVEAVTQWVPLPAPDARAGSVPSMPAITPAPAARIDMAADAASTEFVLGSEHDAPPAADELPGPSDSAFAFGPVRPPKAVTRAAPTRPPHDDGPPAAPRPAPRSNPTPGPQAGESWVARFWWLLVLGALVVGFGTSYLIRGQRETAADAIRKAPARAVSPNSP